MVENIKNVESTRDIKAIGALIISFCGRARTYEAYNNLDLTAIYGCKYLECDISKYNPNVVTILFDNQTRNPKH